MLRSLRTHLRYPLGGSLGTSYRLLLPHTGEVLCASWWVRRSRSLSGTIRARGKARGGSEPLDTCRPGAASAPLSRRQLTRVGKPKVPMSHQMHSHLSARYVRNAHGPNSLSIIFSFPFRAAWTCAAFSSSHVLPSFPSLSSHCVPGDARGRRALFRRLCQLERVSLLLKRSTFRQVSVSTSL